MAGGLSSWAGLFILVAATHVLLTYGQQHRRSFVIDYENNRFLKDGEPFQIISGSMHYYRTLPEQWEERLATMKTAGLNTVQTYIEWSSHEPENDHLDFEGRQDLIRFIKIAERLGFFVILRPGPFIDSERDMGGLPYWLLSETNTVRLRSSDERYLKYVDRYFFKLLPPLKPLLYSNGGPILMLQVENEYGSYEACDFVYTTHLKNAMRRYLGPDALLYTTDGGGDDFFKCGKNDGAYSTVDFGAGADVVASFAAQRRHQERGPLMNSEFYPGWIDHWGEKHAHVNASSVAKTLRQMLSMNASVNIYMFHGGTSFGCKSGANIINGVYAPNPTSYDFDAPMNEAGDPTEKFEVLRNVISEFLPGPPPGPVPSPKEKMALGPFTMRRVLGLEDIMAAGSIKTSKFPLSFEQVGHGHGLMIYYTKISFRPRDPALLRIPGLRDRGYVYVENEYRGLLSRMDNVYDILVPIKKGQTLAIVVENQGRVADANGNNDTKGIISNVTLSGMILTPWAMMPIPLEEIPGLRNIDSSINFQLEHTEGIGAYFVDFPAPEDEVLDTFLQVDGWKKGFAFLNNFNLGRYWPVMGPQMTLYVPSVLFREHNRLILLELERAPCSLFEDCSVEFVKTHVINGTVPMNGGNESVRM
ncbi:beta-galactosidase [Ixodes scapularis]|uniref:beta-galactosidase n=1 Tax=Ixodes scapularis TaxID=6945 RepID=UPI001C38A0BB|nr:beta-galactosidase [Ixodes scapularis]